MYSHGLVAIVFCEAYAMTEDTTLLPYAQESIWFIEDAQDPYNGGWRYEPRQPGDTSVVGWQLMALKSAKLSGLRFDSKTIKLAGKFLDSVSINSGAIYGYETRPTEVHGRHRARTAIGLLCRMYMGWDRFAPGIADGVAWLSELGPSVDDDTCDMYYNYYATQLMKHYGDEYWDQWNSVMRDYLIATQSTKGVTAGSWMMNTNGFANELGGRLYMTALAAMTLEVYYRYMPLYGDDAADEEFPLD